MTWWRITCSRRPGSRLYGLLFEAADFVMAPLMLAGIKNRAERLPTQLAAAQAGPGRPGMAGQGGR